MGFLWWFSQPYVYGWVMVVLTLVGLVGLYWYVRYTYDIAKATRLQGEILSHPAVSITLSTFRDSDDFTCPAAVTVSIHNHSSIHAKVKLRLQMVWCKGEQRLSPEPHRPFDGTSVLAIFAQQEYRQFYLFRELKDEQFQEGDYVFITGHVEVSPHDADRYRPGPEIRYAWIGVGSRPGWTLIAYDE